MIISFISPIQNEENFLNFLFKRIDEYYDKYDFEWVFIDDHSTDKSLDLLENFAQNKDKICIDTNSYNDELIGVKEFDQGDYILFPGQTVKAYNKLKVTEIRKIAEKKNINLYIYGLKKKTKKMLIDEILQL